LRHACSTCHRLVDVRWDVCPYCGADQSEAIDSPEEPATGEVGAGRRRQRAPAPLQAIDGGRAPRKTTRETDESRPRSLPHAGDETGDDVGLTAQAEGGEPAEHEDFSGATTAPVDVRGRSGRARATARRQGGSGN
jgi:hypothetical protein